MPLALQETEALLHAKLYLKHRGRTWTYRRRIPAELTSTLGLTEFIRSLRTPMFWEARRRAALPNAQLEIGLWRVATAPIGRALEQRPDSRSAFDTRNTASVTRTDGQLGVAGEP